MIRYTMSQSSVNDVLKYKEAIAEGKCPFNFYNDEDARSVGMEFYKRNIKWNERTLTYLFRLMFWTFEDPSLMERSTLSGTIEYHMNHGYSLYCEDSEYGWYRTFGRKEEDAATVIMRAAMEMLERKAAYAYEESEYADEDYYGDYEDMIWDFLGEPELNQYKAIKQAIKDRPEVQSKLKEQKAIKKFASADEMYKNTRNWKTATLNTYIELLKKEYKEFEKLAVYNSDAYYGKYIRNETGNVFNRMDYHHNVYCGYKYFLVRENSGDFVKCFRETRDIVYHLKKQAADLEKTAA